MSLMNRLINGKYLILLTSLPVVAVTSLIIFQSADLQSSLMLALRFTAQYSLILFSLAFIATSLQLFAKNEFSMWIRKNRRYLGLSFAASHFVHGLVILTLSLKYSDFFQQIASPVSIAFGSVGFFFIFILTLTSSDYAIKKIGFSQWRNIHRIGMYYIWFIFIASYLPRALRFPIYWPLVLFLLICLVMRLAYSRKKILAHRN
jgi:DMSO/TMAO reductase YedYZ heme-binding membrane subunit